MYTPCVDEGICVAVTQTTVKQKKQKKTFSNLKKIQKRLTKNIHKTNDV